MTQEEVAFWPTYSWADNPDQQGNVLTPRKYDRIQPCTLAELQLQRIDDRKYSFVIPPAGTKMHQQAKLRRWGLAILLSAPRLDIGEGLQVRNQLLPRHPQQLVHVYAWEYVTMGHVRGTMVDNASSQGSVIQLEQASNGIHWTVAASNIEDQQTAADCQKLRPKQHIGGIVFMGFHGCPIPSRTSTSYWR